MAHKWHQHAHKEMNEGLRPMRCCEGEKRVLSSLRAVKQLLSAVVGQPHQKYSGKLHDISHDMIPTEEATSHESFSDEAKGRQTPDDVMLAGYKECAREALTWLLNLGYRPGHPLLRSLVAHLTKKQAYLEKMNLETFLIEETRQDEGESEQLAGEAEEKGTENYEKMNDAEAYEYCALQIEKNFEFQKALIDLVYRGCDLRYESN